MLLLTVKPAFFDLIAISIIFKLTSTIRLLRQTTDDDQDLLFEFYFRSFATFIDTYSKK